MGQYCYIAKLLYCYKTMEKKFLGLDDLNAYKKAIALARFVWEIVSDWDYFAKDTIGKQFVRAADSISANIAEGFGRYSKKEKIQFYRYSYASIIESIDWNQKAKDRKLITEEQFVLLQNQLQQLPKEVHHLISFTQQKLTI